jgi:putative ABC transport system substrate-binding protein
VLFISVSDPIGSRFVKDLARPGGNVTGFQFPTDNGRRMARETARRCAVQNVGLVMHPEPPNFGYLKLAEAAAASTKLHLVRLDVHNAAEIERALAMMASQTDSAPLVIL